MMKKYIYLAFLLLVMCCLIVGCAKKKSAQQQMPPAVVDVTTAKTINYQPKILATGTITAFEGIMVKPEIAGKVTQIFFKSGEDVKAGDPLIQLNPDILAAQVTLAKADLTLSELNFKRNQDLFTKKAVSVADLDKARATYEMNRAKLEQAQAELAQSLIKAPFDGRLGLRQISLGDYVKPGDNLVNLQRLDPLQVDFSVPGIYLGKLTVGQGVVLYFNAYPDRTFQGSVFAFDSVVDPNTRTLALRAAIPNKDKVLIPGAFVEVTLFIGSPQKMITIPQTAIVFSDEGNFVYRVVNSRAVKTPVVVETQQEDAAIIKKGLQPGDVIISAGQMKTSDGAPVIVKPIAAKSVPASTN